MTEVLAKGRALAPRRLLLQELRLVYAGALEAYLADGSEASRSQARDIGRWAIAQGTGVLKATTVHHECLGRILVRLSGVLPFKEGLRRAAEFLCEVLAQYELAHRGSREAAPALRALNEKMEREIQRIALAVHDEAGQLLYAARLAISAAADAATPTVRERLAEVETILNRAEQELRQLSHDLRPTILDDLGLVPALQFLAERVSRTTGIRVHFESSLEGRLASNVETALYRIVQEALGNVSRHSRARNVTVDLRRELSRLTCLVQDDGVGFDPAILWKRERGLGLIGIRDRALSLGGRMQIRSRPEGGTELLVVVPLKRRAGQSDVACAAKPAASLEGPGEPLLEFSSGHR